MILSADTLTALSFLMAAISFVFASIGSKARNELAKIESDAKREKCNISSTQRRNAAIACWASAFPCAAFLVFAAVAVTPAVVSTICDSICNFCFGCYSVERAVLILFYILILYLAAYSSAVLAKVFSAWHRLRK